MLAVYVNEEFSKYMKAGSVILDIASNSAYTLPSIMQHIGTFKLAETDEKKFLKKMKSFSHVMKDQYYRSGFAYALSKQLKVVSYTTLVSG